MIPTLDFQGAVRARLLADPVIARHIDPHHIRMGSARPEQLPAILLTPTRTEILGRAAGGQVVAEVAQMVHVWAHQDGSGTAENIGAAALVSMLDAPATAGFSIDSWERPSIVWSDQAAAVADCAHGAIALRAVIRWTE